MAIIQVGEQHGDLDQVVTGGGRMKRRGFFFF